MELQKLRRVLLLACFLTSWDNGLCLFLPRKPGGRVVKYPSSLDNVMVSMMSKVWYRKCVQGCFDNYVPPRSSPIEQVHRVRVQMTENQIKRRIYSFSDTHFGSYWSKHMVTETKRVMPHFLANAHLINAIVLNGDILEMWYTSFDVAPQTVQQYTAEWTSGKHEALKVFANAIKTLADQHGVHIYYVRGNHDHDITEEAVHAVFGPNITFVPGILIYEIQQGAIIYRIRFEHGHDFDLYNSYRLSETPGNMLMNQPVGYYVSRVQSKAKDTTSHEFSSKAYEFVGSFLSSGAFDLVGRFLMQPLSSQWLENKYTSWIMKSILGFNVHPNDNILMDRNGSVVLASQVLHFPLLSKTIQKYGIDRTFDMWKFSIGDPTDFVETCSEDVVVIGHLDMKELKFLPGHVGPVLYVNDGSWYDRSSTFSYAELIPPGSEDGLVEVRYDHVNKMDP